MDAEDHPKSYDECLAEIQELRASPDYNNWGAETRPNKGKELTRESLEMTPEFMDACVKKFNRLFASKPHSTDNK